MQCWWIDFGEFGVELDSVDELLGRVVVVDAVSRRLVYVGAAAGGRREGRRC
jgi:hypothetical protein